MTSSVANREGFPLSELVQLTAMVQEVILRENSDLLRTRATASGARGIETACGRNPPDKWACIGALGQDRAS